MADVIDIKNVPKSPNTGLESKAVYNPMDEDFTGYYDGDSYVIPAGKSKEFPEFLAYHLAKHLSKYIVKNKWEIKIQKEAIGQIAPDVAKAVPTSDLQKMMMALLTGKKATFQALKEMPKADQAAPAIEDKTQSADALEDKEEKAEKLKEIRIANLDKARIAKEKKKAEREAEEKVKEEEEKKKDEEEKQEGEEKEKEEAEEKKE